jgi:transposase-like protein
MGRKPKVTMEVKVKACKDYSSGTCSFASIAEAIGVNYKTVSEWYYAYQIHGEDAFSYSNKNNSYSKEFKEALVSDYVLGKYSAMQLGAKYNISVSLVKKWIKKHYNGIENKDYDPKGEVYTMKSRKTTFEERLQIVEWVIAHDMNYKQAADKYAIKYALIYQWVKKYKKDGEEGLKHKKRGPRAKSKIDESTLSEVELLKLKLEREKALREKAEFRLELFKKKEEFAQKRRFRK